MQEVHVGEQKIKNIRAAGNRDITNTESEAAADAEIILQTGRGEVAKQTIDGHAKGLAYVKDQLGIT